MSNSASRNIKPANEHEGDFDLEETVPIPVMSMPEYNQEAANDAGESAYNAVRGHLERLVELAESANATLEGIAATLEKSTPRTRRRTKKKKKAVRKTS